MIVFEDANLDLAAKAAVWGAFCNSGQSCSSVERLYVHESVADDLTRKLVDETKKLKQGVGDAEDISIGAMSSERQLKIVEDHVEDFRAAGAKIETGGRSPDALVRNERRFEEKSRTSTSGPQADDGVRVPLFYEPTVITGATNEMRDAGRDLWTDAADRHIQNGRRSRPPRQRQRIRADCKRLDTR